jgi:hypothetical protein
MRRCSASPTHSALSSCDPLAKSAVSTQPPAIPPHRGTMPLGVTLAYLEASAARHGPIDALFGRVHITWHNATSWRICRKAKLIVPTDRYATQWHGPRNSSLT